MKRFLANSIWVLIFALGLVSCFPTRNVPAGSYLHQKDSYKIKGQRVQSHDISSYYLQKTNKKFLFLKPNVWFYDLGSIFKDSSKLNLFFTKTIGEPPILFDSTLIGLTTENILLHFKNLGYYDAEVRPMISEYKYFKVASVKYLIYPNTPYHVRNTEFDIDNPRMRSFVLADWNKTLLDSGSVFSLEQLKKERERIANGLKNLGYYYFQKQQISFQADTSLQKHQVDLKIKIQKRGIRVADSIQLVENKQYKFRRIYIYPELKENNDFSKMDTTVLSYDFDRTGDLEYYFIHDGEMGVNPKAILQAIFIKPNRFYKYDDVVQSYQSLYTLNNYKYININIKDLNDEDGDYGLLDCHIQLSRLAKYSISSDSEVKNTGGDFGIEQSLGFVSRNTFKNGEILKVNLRGALEVNSLSDDKDILNLFNTFEVGASASLEVPRFLAPVKRNFFSRYFNPKTIIVAGYNYQDRPDYRRTIVNANFGYKWKRGVKITHIFNPLELSSVKIFPEPEFQEVIDEYEDPRIKYSYQDHLVLGMSYSYIYSRRKLHAKRPYDFFFSKLDLGGFPYAGISRLFGGSNDAQGQYWVGGLPFTQFVRIETDYRYYIPFSNGNFLHAFRGHFGIGIPLGGSVAIPFEKSFYIGGANSLRAWTLGTLGPGSFDSNSSSFEMTGDIRIEANYEFRFPISGAIKGAAFLDVGNIYLLKESKAMPGGEFKIHNFYEKLAADIGLGLRYDMSFLVIRFDFAHSVYEPYKDEGERWSRFSTGVSAINFAIGYPF